MLTKWFPLDNGNTRLELDRKASGSGVPPPVEYGCVIYQFIQVQIVAITGHTFLIRIILFPGNYSTASLPCSELRQIAKAATGDIGHCISIVKSSKPTFPCCRITRSSSFGLIN